VAKALALCALLLAGCGSAAGNIPAGTTHPAPVLYQRLAYDPTIIAAVGDSLTSGYAMTDLTQTWPRQVGRALGSTIVEDDGNPGATTLTIAQHQAAGMRPDATLVFLWVGMNDEPRIAQGTETVSDYKAALELAIATIRAKAPGATLVLLTVPDIGRLAGQRYFRHTLDAAMSGAALAINQVVWNEGTFVADVSSGPEYYVPLNLAFDQFHPDESGSTAIAQKIVTLLVGRGER
jgi:lysophospholipase L1-like esterase